MHGWADLNYFSAICLEVICINEYGLIWISVQLYDGADKLLVFICFRRLLWHQQLQAIAITVGMIVSSIFLNFASKMKTRTPSSTLCINMSCMLKSIWVEHRTGNLRWPVWNGYRGTWGIGSPVTACLEWAQICFIACIPCWYNLMASNLVQNPPWLRL